MLFFFRVVCAVVAGLAMTSIQAAAQAELRDHLASAHLIASPSQTTPSPLQRMIHVEFTNVKIADAVAQIAERGGVRLSYRSSVLGDRTVNLSAEKIAVSDAFARVLVGTGLQVVPGPNGVFLLIQDASQTKAEGIVTGRVLNAKTKQPIAGARIVIGDQSVPVTTAEDGSFRLTLKPGEHRISIRAVGFARQERQVVMESEKTQTIEIALEPSASVLDEVIVTGTVVATERKEIPTPITVIHAEELERRGITRIEELFRGEIPGVFVRDRGIEAYEDYEFKATGSEVFVRGSSNLYSEGTPTPLKTYVDGVEIADPNHLGLIDPQSIERIEIITGPQAATIYGSGAMGGVMQIFTKKRGTGRRSEFVTNLKIGWLENSFSSAKTPTHNHGISIKGNMNSELAYAITGTYVYSGQWQPNLFSQRLGASLGLTYQKNQFHASGSVSATSGRNGTTSATANNNSVLRNKTITGEWRPAGDGTMVISSTVASHFSNLMSLSATYRHGNQIQHTVTVGRNSNALNSIQNRPIFSAVADSLNRSRKARTSRTTASYNSTWNPGQLGIVGVVFTTGINGSFGERLNIDGCHATESTNPYLTCPLGAGVPVARSISRNSTGVFGTLRFGLFEKLFTMLAVRAERNSSYGDNYKVDWTPTNGITYTEDIGNLTIKLLLSYGRATRAPSPEQRDQVMSNFTQTWTPNTYILQKANPMLRPEYSRGPQGGVELYFGNYGSFTVNRYVQEVTDLIASVVVDSVIRRGNSSGVERATDQWQYVNIGAIRSHGWEGQGALHIGGLGLKGTYSWNDSRIKYSLDTRQYGSFQAGGGFYRLPTHMGSVTGSYAIGKTNLTVVMNWTGSAIGTSQDHMVYQEELRSRSPMYVQRKQNSPPLYTNVSPFSRSGYAKVNISALHRVTSAAAVTIHISNLSNSFRSDASIFNPTLGRQTNIGVSLRYR